MQIANCKKNHKKCLVTKIPPTNKEAKYLPATFVISHQPVTSA